MPRWGLPFLIVLPGKRFQWYFGVLFVCVREKESIRMSPAKTSVSCSKGVFVSLSDPYISVIKGKAQPETALCPFLLWGENPF